MLRIELSEDGSEYLIHVPRKQFEKLDPEGAPKISTPRLTTRQEVVLELVRAGKCNKEIAAILGITKRTAMFHVANLLEIFDVSSRYALPKL